MAVIQLSGGAVEAPEGALNIRLSQTNGVELVLLDDYGTAVAPNFQVTRAEVVIVPSGPLAVAVQSTNGAPFPSGTRIGVTVKAASGQGDEVVRAPSEVGGRQAATLIEIRSGQVVDLGGQATAVEKGWMQRGNYAYHVNHKQGGTRTTKWAAVLDGSAMAHHGANVESFRSFLELVLGIAGTGFGEEPEAWFVATRPVRDVTSALDGDEIDWSSVIGEQPAPWPSLGDAVDAALRKLPDDGALVLISDGAFVDHREVRQRLEGRDSIVVAIGRSRFGARPEDRPEHFWEETLEALASFPRVVSVASLANIADGAPDVADAMFPGGAA